MLIVMIYNNKAFLLCVSDLIPRLPFQAFSDLGFPSVPTLFTLACSTWEGTLALLFLHTAVKHLIYRYYGKLIGSRIGN